MSFLNPVNETVLRFKSTDAGAPQINYNARTAGDVKAVLKACLVTGYGAVSSAGWTAANEVENVIEFVSPSAAMSDYRFGIDDTGVTSTTWYYVHQNVRVSLGYSILQKNFSYSLKTHVSNGWQLLVTKRGLILIESIQHSVVSKMSSRITYINPVKLALLQDASRNMSYFSIGHNASMQEPFMLFNGNGTTYPSYAPLSPVLSGVVIDGVTDSLHDLSSIDLVSKLYVVDKTQAVVIAQQPGILLKTTALSDDLYGLEELSVDGRPMLKVCAGYTASTSQYVNSRARVFLIYLDQWEY